MALHYFRRINKHISFMLFALLSLSLFSANIAFAYEIQVIELDDTEIEVRKFEAKGKKLLLGFACDQGSSEAEEATSATLAEDGVEVWMPDMLSAYMLPNLKSSLNEIPTDSLVKVLEAALDTGKKVYLIASGADTELVLRMAKAWEAKHKDKPLGGAILMFPRLNKGEPVPGSEPEYQDAVGTTTLPLMILEGGRTPNRWGIGHLTKALEASGSIVYAKLIPDVRGYFFKRDNPDEPEALVTKQLGGLIKASLFFLGKAH